MNREFLQTIQVAGQSLPEDVIESILTRHSEALSAAVADPGVTGGTGGKTFTQEDVNRIVSERLALHTGDSEREAALNAREAKLTCREYLLQKNYPAKLLELLDTSDAARFQAAADAMAMSFPGILTPEAPLYRAGTGTWQSDGAEALADAFKFKI